MDPAAVDCLCPVKHHTTTTSPPPSINGRPPPSGGGVQWRGDGTEWRERVRREKEEARAVPGGPTRRQQMTDEESAVFAFDRRVSVGSPAMVVEQWWC
ncbi:hypothetical protein Hdeb2414_s0017g00512971 [Helianthus debilis subsp. tardiflorus]